MAVKFKGDFHSDVPQLPYRLPEVRKARRPSALPGLRSRFR